MDEDDLKSVTNEKNTLIIETVAHKFRSKTLCRQSSHSSGIQNNTWMHRECLSPHDALKNNFTSLKTDLIFLQLTVLEGKFP